MDLITRVKIPINSKLYGQRATIKKIDIVQIFVSNWESDHLLK